MRYFGRQGLRGLEIAPAGLLRALLDPARACPSIGDNLFSGDAAQPVRAQAEFRHAAQTADRTGQPGSGPRNSNRRSAAAAPGGTPYGKSVESF
jgi:hypothetical protein